MKPFGNLLSVIPLLFSSNNPTQLSVEDIVQGSKDLYSDLNNVGPYHYSASPTIQFSFVSPPTPTSSWNNVQVPEGKSDPNNESVFDRVVEDFDNDGKQKPLALIIPGLDGVCISSTTQFDDLSSNFELWRMKIDAKSDRTSFTDLVTSVVQFLDEATKNKRLDTKREVVLIGESFGGLLVPNVALRIENRSKRRVKMNRATDETFDLKGLVMVNPATSFDESQWGTLAPFLFSLRHLERDTVNDLPTPYSVVGGLALSATIPDSTQFQQIVDIILASYGNKVPSLELLSESLGSMSEGFKTLAENLPADTLEHRITRWFPVGTSLIQPKLSTLDVTSLVVGGTDDNMLPTKSESERLVKEMPNCQKVDIKGSGHFVLDQRVNLTDIILKSHIFPVEEETRKKDPITEWEKPSKEVFDETMEERIKPLRRLTSPIFFSTDKMGKRRKGLSHLPGPDEGPLLFVANHQLLGFDLGLIISQLIEERDLWVRGLAHPVIFNAVDQIESGGRTNDSRDPPMTNDRSRNGAANGAGSQSGLFQKFGAVMVTPRNFYRLMETKQNGLLFPGGVREVFHGKDEAYKLFWPEKVDFVRTAAKFNATIIPLSAVGSADSANILVDAPDMVKLPFGLGERVANFSSNVTAGRFDKEKSDELFTPPFLVPKVPARHYFMFGRPMSTADLDHKNKQECETLYEEIKAEMNRGFDDILRARENDPYKDSLQRLALEQITGKPAPTFGMEEFH